MSAKYEQLQCIYQSQKVIIHKVRNILDNQTYVQKTYIQNKNEGLNALQILSMTKNQFILNIKEYFENDEEQLIIIQEYCDQGDLRNFVQQTIGYKIQESILWSIVLQLSYTVLELNELGIHHRVLIPENIFLLGRTEGYQIRVNDFHKASKQTLCQLPCPAIYLPYEYYSDGQYTQKSHIWQIGHILYYMACQKLLFPLTSLEQQVKEQLRRGKVQLNIPNVYSQGLIKFISTCLAIRERERPNILQVIRMPEFKDALEKGYYIFSLEQKRHLQKWINSTEESITKPVLYSFNEFDLRSPRQLNNEVTIKKSFRQERLPQIYATKKQEVHKSREPIIKQSSSPKPIQYQKFISGVIYPIHFHKKKSVGFSQTVQQFTLPYVRELDSVFSSLVESKKNLCSTWLGSQDYHFLKSQVKTSKPNKLEQYVKDRHPNLDSSMIVQQVHDIVQLEDQKRLTVHT